MSGIQQDKANFEEMEVSHSSYGDSNHQEHHCSDDMCDCDSSERNQQVMQLHTMAAASRFGERGFKCPYQECSRGYASRQRLKLHIESIHLNTAVKYFCTACNEGKGCGFYAFERSTVVAHMRTHTGDKPYACRICGRRFSIAGNRNDHEKRHLKFRPYECELCPRRFYRRYLRDRHSAKCMNKKVRHQQAPQDQNNLYAHQITQGDKFINPQSLAGFQSEYLSGETQDVAAQCMEVQKRADQLKLVNYCPPPSTPLISLARLPEGTHLNQSAQGLSIQFQQVQQSLKPVGSQQIISRVIDGNTIGKLGSFTLNNGEVFNCNGLNVFQNTSNQNNYQIKQSGVNSSQSQFQANFSSISANNTVGNDHGISIYNKNITQSNESNKHSLDLNNFQISSQYSNKKQSLNAQCNSVDNANTSQHASINDSTQIKLKLPQLSEQANQVSAQATLKGNEVASALPLQQLQLGLSSPSQIIQQSQSRAAETYLLPSANGGPGQLYQMKYQPVYTNQAMLINGVLRPIIQCVPTLVPQELCQNITQEWMINQSVTQGIQLGTSGQAQDNSVFSHQTAQANGGNSYSNTTVTGRHCSSNSVSNCQQQNCGADATISLEQKTEANQLNMATQKDSTVCTPQPSQPVTKEVTLPSLFSLKSTCDASLFGSAVIGGQQHAMVNSNAQIYHQEDKLMNDFSDDEELAESQQFYKYQREDAENRLKRTLFDQMVKKYRFTCSAPII